MPDSKTTEMRLRILLVAVVFLFGFQTINGDPVVPNEATAIRVAEALWLPMFGKDIYKERPFKAHLEGDTVWVVQGTPHYPRKYKRHLEKIEANPNYFVVKTEGVLVARIRKIDCKVLLIYHSK